MSAVLTPRGSVLLEACRRNMQLVEELAKHAPHDAHVIYTTCVSHVRSAHPQALLEAQAEELARG